MIPLNQMQYNATGTIILEKNNTAIFDTKKKNECRLFKISKIKMLHILY